MTEQYEVGRQSLVSLYTRYLSLANELPQQLHEDLGTPFLILPRPGWYSAKHRILLIGQEPYDWGFPNNDPTLPWPFQKEIWNLQQAIEVGGSIEALMDAYRYGYDTAQGDRGAFSAAFDTIANRTGVCEVVTSNLIRCTLGERRTLWFAAEEDRRRVLDWQRGLLTAEIEILNPTAGVFFTGPTTMAS